MNKSPTLQSYRKSVHPRISVEGYHSGKSSTNDPTSFWRLFCASDVILSTFSCIRHHFAHCFVHPTSFLAIVSCIRRRFGDFLVHPTIRKRFAPSHPPCPQNEAGNFLEIVFFCWPVVCFACHPPPSGLPSRTCIRKVTEIEVNITRI